MPGSALSLSLTAPAPHRGRPPRPCRTRTKKIAGIKSLDVYALALYVDQKAAKHTLGHKFSGQAPAQVSHDALLGGEDAVPPAWFGFGKI